MNGLPFDPAEIFGAPVQWSWRFLDVGVLELHTWIHDGPLHGQIVIERGAEGQDGFDNGPTLIRCEDERDMADAMERFRPWEPRA